MEKNRSPNFSSKHFLLNKYTSILSLYEAFIKMLCINII